tara:strand:+ start:30982 stop:31284 length:303 start_codon:yes stop_codon:yes gene_type:complete
LKAKSLFIVGYLMLLRMNDATATSAMLSFSAYLNGMPLEVRKSMTYDQGREMAHHAEIMQQTRVAIYFCDSHNLLATRQQRKYKRPNPSVLAKKHRLIGI